eukprot:1198182-Rhodomonas_salina.2
MELGYQVERHEREFRELERSGRGVCLSPPPPRQWDLGGSAGVRARVLLLFSVDAMRGVVQSEGWL